MQLKNKLQYYWRQHVYPNGPLLLLLDTQILEHDYINIVALDAQVGLNCDTWINFFVCWDVNGVEGPGLRVYDTCRVKFKDCQGADFLHGSVKTEAITLMRT